MKQAVNLFKKIHHLDSWNAYFKCAKQSCQKQHMTNVLLSCVTRSCPLSGERKRRVGQKGLKGAVGLELR